MRSVGGLLLLPMLLPVSQPPVAGQLRLTMLDVGQGTALMLQTAHHQLLYDTGPAFGTSDSGSRIILPWLRGEGLTRLDGVVLSHDDNDHTGGAASLLQQFDPGWLLHSLPEAHPLLKLRPARALRCQAGQSWQWDGIRFQVLWPDSATIADPAIKDNERSCVIRVDAVCGSMLLTGDLEKAGEQRLLSQPLRADVLLVPHHGSKTSSSQAFIDAVQPRLALVSAGYRNRFGHPRADVMQRYLNSGAHIIRSDTTGAVELRCQPGGWQFEAWRDKVQRYWR